jgi:hypothetical protein
MLDSSPVKLSKTARLQDREHDGWKPLLAGTPHSNASGIGLTDIGPHATRSFFFNSLATPSSPNFRYVS